jgi:hypothetical protein
VAHIYLDSYGVLLDVEIQAERLRPAVESILPPGWQTLDGFPEDGHFTVRDGPNDTYDVLIDGAPVATGQAADVAIHVLDAQLRARIAVLARDRIFVHAGVVAISGRALLLPGPTFIGKSALVAALIARGAEYYSDEFAVLDENGLVHPYPRSLSLRAAKTRYGDYTTVKELGGRPGSGPAKPALIAITRYVPGARWDPQEQKGGVGALTLLTNAVPARPRTDATIRAVSQAAAGARVLQGDRGEADETAEMLLAELGAVS